MPQQKESRTITKTHPISGRKITFNWSGDREPTDEDLIQISRLENKARRSKLEHDKAIEPSWQEKIVGKVISPAAQAKLYEGLSYLSEKVAPPPMPQEEVEKLPVMGRGPFEKTPGLGALVSGSIIGNTRLGRFAREQSSTVTDPANVAAVAAPAVFGPAGAVAAGAIYGPQMLYHAPEVISEAIEKPSLESAARAGLLGLGILGAGAGIKGGMKSFSGKFLPSRGVKPPTQAEILSSEQVSEVPSGARQISPAKPKLLTEGEIGTIPPKTGGPIVTPPPEAPPQTPTGKRFVKGGPVVSEPGTVLPPKLEVAPPSEIPIPETGVKKVPETGLPSKTGGIEEIPPWEQTVQDIIGISRGRLQYEGENLNGLPIFRAPYDTKITFAPSRTLEGTYNILSTTGSASTGLGDITEAQMQQLKQAIQDRETPQLPEVKEPQISRTSQIQERIQAPLQNKWLRQSDDAVLEQIYPGSTGKLKQEIETVMKERGLLGGEDLISKMEIKGKEGEIRAAAGMDPRIVKVLGGNLYSGDLGRIAVKEMLQNAVDSVRPMGTSGQVSVNYNTQNKSIIMQDNGTGMLPEIAKNEFVDIGGSSKPAGATGGFGIAKVAIFSNAKNIQVETVAKDPSGKYIKTTITGSGEDWIDTRKGLELHSEEVSPTQTGTKLGITFNDDVKFDQYQAQGFMQSFLRSNKLAQTFDFRIDNQPVKTTEYDYSTGKIVDVVGSKKPLATVKFEGGDAEFYTSKETKGTDYIRVQVLNNGIPQFEMPVYTRKAAQYPRSIEVNIKPSGTPESANYPFRPDREGLRDRAKEAVDDWISDKLIKAAAQAELNKYKEALGGATSFPSGKYKIYDTEQNVSPEVLNEISSNVRLQSVVNDIGHIHDNITTMLSKFSHLYPNSTFGGIGLGRGYLGINISGELAIGAKGKPNLILWNPFTTLSEVDNLVDVAIQDHEIPNMFANQTVATMLHEITHNVAREHSEEFSGQLTRNIGNVNNVIAKFAGSLEKKFAPEFLNELRVMRTKIDAGPKREDIFGKIGVHAATTSPKQLGAGEAVTFGDTEGRTGLPKVTEPSSTNTPRVMAPSESRISERGMIRPGAFFPRKVPKIYRMTEAAKKGKTPTYEEVKTDANDLWRTINAWATPAPDHLEQLGNNSLAAKEISRLLQKERTERNRLFGTYSDAVHQTGMLSNRTASMQNLSDEEIGNRRVKDERGNIITVIPEGTAGANAGNLIEYKGGEVVAAPGFTLIPPAPGNLIDVIEKGAMPMNARVEKTANGLRNILNQMNVRLEQAGGKTEGTVGQLFPHKFSAQFEEAFPDNLTSDAYTRDRSVIFDHIKELSGRISAAETLGPGDINSPLMKKLLNEAGKAGGDKKLMTAIMKRVMGKEEVSPFRASESRTYRAVSKLLTAKYLPLFALSNVATLTNIAARGSVKRILPAMVYNLRTQNRLGAPNLKGGGLSELLTDELAPESFFTKLYGIKESEQYMRGTASTVGRGTSVDLLEKLKTKNPNGNFIERYFYKAAYRTLKNMLLKNDVEMAALIKRGKLSNREESFAGGRFSEMTQGLVDPIDLPYQWSSKNTGILLDFIFTYKRFAYQSTKILFQAIKENPVKAIPTIAILGQVMGELIGDAKSALKGALASQFTDEETADAMIREIEQRGEYLRRVSPFFKDHPLVARVIDNYLQAWALGILGDALMAATEGPSGIAEFVTGPFFSMVGELATDIVNVGNELLRDDEIDWDAMEEELSKFLRSQAPAGIGSAITRSEKGAGGTGPTVNAPRLPKLPTVRQ